MSIANACYVSAMPVKAGKNEEARERTRQALLRAGAALFVENSQRNPFADLPLRAVCTRAGYSTGAFYANWSNIDEYHQALAEYLAAAADEEEFIEDLASVEAYVAASGETSALGKVIRAADRDFEALLESSLWDAMQLLNVTWGRTRFQQQMAFGYQQLDHATGEAYASVLRQLDREPRPPFDWDRIGVVLQGLIEGLGMRYKVDPASVPPSSDASPGLYATVVAAVLGVLTRPTGAKATVEDTLQLLLDPSCSDAENVAPEHEHHVLDDVQGDSG
jgi:AcrR family transcriptional regulator